MLIAAATFLGLLISFGYAVVCAMWPFTSCGRCEGSGRKLSPSKKNWRRCKKCKGSGSQVRLGRRFWVWAAGIRKDAAG